MINVQVYGMSGICFGIYPGTKNRPPHALVGKLMLVAVTEQFMHVKRVVKSVAKRHVSHGVSLGVSHVVRVVVMRTKMMVISMIK